MNYIENLQHVAKTRCILDLVRHGATGLSFRVWESIMYNKKLITDNNHIIESEFYDKRYITLLKEKECDIELIKSQSIFTNPYKKNITPDQLLRYIADNLY